jgi:hypothetical protein
VPRGSGSPIPCIRENLGQIDIGGPNCLDLHDREPPELVDVDLIGLSLALDVGLDDPGAEHAAAARS